MRGRSQSYLFFSPLPSPAALLRSLVLNSHYGQIPSTASLHHLGHFTTPQPLSHCLSSNEAQGHWLMLKYMGRAKTPVWAFLSHPSPSPGRSTSSLPSLKSQPCLLHPQIKSWLSSRSTPLAASVPPAWPLQTHPETTSSRRRSLWVVPALSPPLPNIPKRKIPSPPSKSPLLTAEVNQISLTQYGAPSSAHKEGRAPMARSHWTS